MLASEGEQPPVIVRSQRQQGPKHQRQRMVGGLRTVTNRHLNLRHAVADGQRAHQGMQRRQHVRHLLRQDGTFLQVGDVAGFFLVKPDQHPALRGHVPHGQTGAEAVAPGGAFHRRQHLGGPYAPQMPEGVFEHALLVGHLGTQVGMLQVAATADAIARTSGIDAVGIGLGNALDVGHVEAGLAAQHARLDLLAGQSALHEHHLAAGMGNALPVQIHRFDPDIQ